MFQRGPNNIKILLRGSRYFGPVEGRGSIFVTDPSQLPTKSNYILWESLYVCNTGISFTYHTILQLCSSYYKKTNKQKMYSSDIWRSLLLFFFFCCMQQHSSIFDGGRTAPEWQFHHVSEQWRVAEEGWWVSDRSGNKDSASWETGTSADGTQYRDPW